jgi:hypothetical protein
MIPGMALESSTQHLPRQLFSAVLAAALLLSAGPTQAQASHCYTRYSGSGGTVDVCEYVTGGSGYIILTNNSVPQSRGMLCFSILFLDGRVSNGCNRVLRPGQSSRSSCYSCNRRTGGVRSVRIFVR